MHLTIGWLYPTKMNIYGDRGNVITLAQRARWRGIPAVGKERGIGDPIAAEAAGFFFGGGRDPGQIAVSIGL